ncbi:MAG: hypothetical protein IPO87_13840 [Flavobacteriales bacterium]|nr:hypothetical protein [Flavobacteriales bacterium]
MTGLRTMKGVDISMLEIDALAINSSAVKQLRVEEAIGRIERAVSFEQSRHFADASLRTSFVTDQRSLRSRTAVAPFG